jgi:ribosomal protein L39E
MVASSLKAAPSPSPPQKQNSEQRTRTQGARTQKQNRRAPTWLVGSSEAKKVPGLVKKNRVFSRVFELPSPSPRNAQKHIWGWLVPRELIKYT